MAKNKSEDFSNNEFVTIGGIVITGTDYETIRKELNMIHNDKTNRAMSFSSYGSQMFTQLAADIRAGKRMRKY
jgi:hypothetical protein